MFWNWSGERILNLQPLGPEANGRIAVVEWLPRFRASGSNRAVLVKREWPALAARRRRGSTALEEDANSVRTQRIGGVEVEPVVLLEKWHVPASRCATFRLMFRTLIEPAEATDILSPCVQHEDVNLMIRDAELLLMPESLQCSRRKPSKLIQVADTMEPYCQVDVFGFVHETSPPPIWFPPGL
jgi:hypothetical protein